MNVKHNPPAMLLTCMAFFIFNALAAQQNSPACKVELKTLALSYTGDCKNGYAHGKGEAAGIDRYVGQFKNGLPHGKGTYYFADSTFYTGNFQDGIKEGKGEFHYPKNGKTDSVVQGYWSADEYRGKTYKTYAINETPFFDRTSITPTAESGRTLSVEISTTTGSPNGTATNAAGAPGVVLTITDVITLDGSFIRKSNDFASSTKYTANYELSQFPVRLQIIISNGQVVNLELFKAAKWTVRFYQNK